MLRSLRDTGHEWGCKSGVALCWASDSLRSSHTSGDQVAGSKGVRFALDRFRSPIHVEQLTSNDPNPSGGFDPDFDAGAPGMDDPNHNIIANLDGLSLFAGENEHDRSLFVGWSSALNLPDGLVASSGRQAMSFQECTSRAELQ